ncbi:YceI family protein [Amycolatopsis nigrescens]|uniref:YceI family protein n=1 Tax=Amycolatopsis nigrescens TaxID=381445 RepID=UPI00036F277F|nr:YceI family protein [Amycolatopsis nigrescens]
MSMQDDFPGYAVGTWVIDTAQSEAGFEIRQFGFSKVRGSFTDFEGTIVTAENPLDSSVNAVMKTASIDTKNKKRDEHLHHDDFLGAEQYPTITFSSTGLRVDGNDFFVDGDLTVRAITKQVTLNLALDGIDVGAGAKGKPQARFTAYTEIDRTDYGVTCGMARAVISKPVKIILKIQADKRD